MKDKLLVTGASGQLGQRVLAHLLDTHNIEPSRIIATSRRPDALSQWAAKGVQVRLADFDDPDALPVAFGNADRVLIISTDALDQPGHRLKQHKNAVQAARQAGARHLLYTSMPQPDDSLIPFAPDHRDTEQAIRDSGLSWTLLRNSWYLENLLGSLPAAIESGRWFTAAGDGQVAQVSREDCARATAAALAAETPLEGVFDITGPELLTTAEMAAIASDVLERPIEAVAVNDEQLVQGMVDAGMPEAMAAFWATFDANTRAGKVAIRTDAVERLTGTPAQSLAAFLEQHKTLLLNGDR